MREVFVVCTEDWEFDDNFEIFLSLAGAKKYCKMYNIPEYKIFHKFVNKLL